MTPTLLGEWLGNLFAFDARVWRTLGPLMARPGFLTTEYLAGRRVRYVPPLRLYFFASVAMFLALAWSGYSIVQSDGSARGGMVSVSATAGSSQVGRPGQATEETNQDEPQDADPQAEEEEEPGWLAAKIEALGEQSADVVNSLYRERLAQTLILLAFAFALFTRVLFPRPHRRLFHHLIFSIHLHAAAFAGIVLVRVLGALIDLVANWGALVLGLLFILYLLAYLFVALRRVHGRSRFSTLWRYLVLGVAYVLTLAVTLVSTLLLTAAFL